MAHLISSSLQVNFDNLKATRELDQLGRLSAADLVAPRPAPIVITVETRSPAVVEAPAPAPATPSQPAAPEPTPADEALASHEVLALRDSLAQLADTNDRVMAQNIALLADLESAQRAVRELRADKDALAVQLKRALSTSSALG